jgi:hypothetical protein
MSYDNNLRGALFKNDRKRDGKRDPDYQGQCEVDRKQFWISAWIETSKKDGSEFMSLRFNPKLAKDTGSVPHKEPDRAPAEGPYDDIPF